MIPCYKKRKEECLQSPNCKWVVGTGCRELNWIETNKKNDVNDKSLSFIEEKELMDITGLPSNIINIILFYSHQTI